MRVEDLMTGPLEPTNEAYAMAKLLGIKMCEAYHNQYSVTFVPAIASNPFGPGDDFDPDDSHVIAALIRRMHEAKIHDAEVVEIWGTGSPRREFIYCDDLADACIFVMREYNSTEPINLGTGFDLSIRELAEMVKKVVGFGGELIYNASKPDGMMRKVLDSSRLREMGWKPRTSFQAALSATYDWFLHGESQAVRSIE
jgi:GDP-L-fucose synthase